MLLTSILGLLAGIAFGQTNTSPSSPTVLDAFKISKLASNYAPTRDKTAGYRRLEFDFTDLSTTPQQNTSCQVILPLTYTGSSTDYPCDDGWFAFEVNKYVNPRTFDLTLKHAYGESCPDCNDLNGEPCTGQEGKGTVSITSTSVKWSGHSSSSGVYRGSVEGDIIVDIDFMGN